MRFLSKLLKLSSSAKAIRSISPRKAIVAAGVAAGSLSGALLITTADFVTPHEGVYTKPYRDPVGVLTWCIGETEGKPKASYTVDECKAMLRAKLPRYYAEIQRCIKVPISDKQVIAFTSFSYNVGSGAFCKSTLLRKLNAGDARGACNELPRWNKAGGKAWKGLTRRRADEQKLCLEGIER